MFSESDRSTVTNAKMTFKKNTALVSWQKRSWPRRLQSKARASFPTWCPLLALTLQFVMLSQSLWRSAFSMPSKALKKPTEGTCRPVRYPKIFVPIIFPQSSPLSSSAPASFCCLSYFLHATVSTLPIFGTSEILALAKRRIENEKRQRRLLISRVCC